MQDQEMPTLSETLANINLTQPKLNYQPSVQAKESTYIPAVIITLLNDGPSTYGTRKLLNSIRDTGSKLLPLVLNASTPETMRVDLIPILGPELAPKIQWTWPIDSKQDGMDLQTNLYRRAYASANWKRVMACMVSHMRAWHTSIQMNSPIVVLEHDAIFVKTFKYRYMTDQGFSNGVIGLNLPLGATRKAKIFHTRVNENKGTGVFPVPIIDDPKLDPPLPSGLAGNSAYVITPSAAKQLIDKTRQIGLWPNDALMCQQLFPWLYVSRPYYTELQNMKSTTTQMN